VRITNILVATLMVLISANIVAEQASMKIGIVAPDAAVFGTEYAQSEIKRTETNPQFASLKTKFDGLLEEMKQLNSEIENKGMTWSADQNDEAQKKMGYLRDDIELIQKKLKSEQKSLQSRIIKATEEKIQEALQELITEEKLTLLLRKEAAIFGGEGIDYTNKLTNRLNKKMN
jgi:outer membrane protein